MRNKYVLQIVNLFLLIVKVFEISAQVPPSDIKSRLLTEDEGCGIPKVQASIFRIVGGVGVAAGDYPWMALLAYENNLGQQSFKCGGSLITSRHVLTAAHCVTPTLVGARLGEHNTDSDEDDAGAVQDIRIFHAERHPEYNKRDGTKDIAILHLERDVIFSNRVRPICLPIDEPIRSRSFVGEKPFIAGWGRLQEGGKTSNILQHVQLPILKNSECRRRYRRKGKLFSDDQFGRTVICAGDLNGGKDSCQGDSGGPMMYPVPIDGDRNRFYQIGIVSYGIGCAKTNTPGVYSRVQKFSNWIQYVINQS